MENKDGSEVRAALWRWSSRARGPDFGCVGEGRIFIFYFLFFYFLELEVYSPLYKTTRDRGATRTLHKRPRACITECPEDQGEVEHETRSP